jgi:hypothetical protein
LPERRPTQFVTKSVSFERAPPDVTFFHAFMEKPPAAAVNRAPNNLFINPR